jgi:hypothetical protein
VLVSKSKQDTTPDAEKRYFELLAAAGPQKRLQMAARLSMSVRELARAGIRAAHPAFSEHQVRAALAARLYGPEIARRVFGYDEPSA